MHGLHSHGNIAVGGQKNHREQTASLNERLMELHPSHVGHAVVKEQAARAPRIIHFQKCSCTLVSHDLPAAHTQQECQTFQLLGIIIHDPYERRIQSFCHCTPPFPFSAAALED